MKVNIRVRGPLGCLVGTWLAAVVYLASVAFWSIWISVGFHAFGDAHLWWWAATRWGLLAPFLLG